MRIIWKAHIYCAGKHKVFECVRGINIETAIIYLFISNKVVRICYVYFGIQILYPSLMCFYNCPKEDYFAKLR